jgi:hypothetical protein
MEHLVRTQLLICRLHVSSQLTALHGARYFTDVSKPSGKPAQPIAKVTPMHVLTTRCIGGLNHLASDDS